MTTKININFFLRNEVLNGFHSTIFSKKKKGIVFSKITVTNNFWGDDNFRKNDVSDDKNE